MLREARQVVDMLESNRDDRIWKRPPTFSTCTPVHLERVRRALIDSWEALESERAALERQKQIWLSDSPRPVDPTRPFCFEASRMKRQWREHDRAADRQGLAVHATIGSTRARMKWFELLSNVIGDDHVIRIRHRYFDEPVLLLRESRFRDLEGTAPSLANSGRPGAESANTAPTPHNH